MIKFEVLMRDYGYKFDGSNLIRKGIPGWTSSEIIGKFRNAMDAAEYLCPIVAEPDYTRRLMKYQG